MPELPEVEVLKMSLEPRLVGRRIVSVEVRERRLRVLVPRTLASDVAGRRVEGLRRRSKYLLIDLEGDKTLVIHLGMSGRLTIAPGRSGPAEPHEHLVFALDRGGRLRFRDPRRFGLALALKTSALERNPHFRDLGVEPLAPGFSGEVLSSLAKGRYGPVKSFLMDGRLVVGVGNIYATESLWRAGIHPARSVARISMARWEALARSVVEVLSHAIREGGTTLNDFADGDGVEGEFQIELAAYDRAGEPCPRCGTAIRRLVQSGRSTYYCPGCQR